MARFPHLLMSNVAALHDVLSSINRRITYV